jgi:hypothetical protein
LAILQEEFFKYNPGNALYINGVWVIGFIVLKLPSDEPDVILQQIINIDRSFKKLVKFNSKLKGGVARSVFIERSWTDGGMTLPEGFIFYKVNIEYESEQ